MKRIIKFIFGLSLAALLFTACEEIHDPVDDLVRTGNFAANVYLELAAGDVKAGDEIGFHAEYWSLDDEFKSLSLQYSVDENLNYSITVPEIKYTWSLDSAGQVRAPVDVLNFEHAPSNYDPETKSYVLNEKFEVSYLLAPVELNNPIDYNEDLVIRLFSPALIERFYDGLYHQVYSSMLNDTINRDEEYNFLKRILVSEEDGMTQEEFDAYFDFVNTTVDGEVVEVPVVKEETAPELIGFLREKPLDAFIYNSTEQYYAITYDKRYLLTAQFKVVNGNNIANFSEKKAIKVL